MSIQKAQLLKGIKGIPVDDLARLIHDEVITLPEAIGAGLESPRIKQLEGVLAELQQQKQAAHAQFAKDAKAASDRDHLLDDIRNNHIDAFKIKESLDKGLIGADDIRRVLDPGNEAGVQRLLSYRKKTITYNAAPPAPRSNATDAFFIGIPRSGKSCILASLFYYIDKKGLVENFAHNPDGTKYRNQLRQEFELGYLPHSTAESASNQQGDKEFISTHMSLGLRNNAHGIVHELNLYDMSGEFVNRTYQRGKGPGTLFNAGYINNGNRKLLFFVIDFELNDNSKLVGEGTQSDKLLFALTLLDSEGILEKCDGIYLLVSKSDKFPIQKNDGSDHYYQSLKDFTRNFLDNEFKNFTTSCEKLKLKYRKQFHVTVYPYSIGEVRFGDVLWTRNDRAPEFIVHMILSHAMYKKGSLLDRVGMAQQ